MLKRNHYPAPNHQQETIKGEYIMGKYLQFLKENAVIQEAEDKKKVDPAKAAEASKKQHEKMVVLQQQLSDAKSALNKAKAALKQGEKSSTATLNAQDRIELISNKIRILQRRS